MGLLGTLSAPPYPMLKGEKMSKDEQGYNGWSNEERICSRCHKKKPISEFYRRKDRPRQFQSHCFSCDKYRTREYRAEIRRQLVEHYSKGTNKCLICGESRIEVLDIDHIKGGGIKDRSKYKTMFQYYLRIKKDLPSGLRILCRNCNWLEWRKRQKENLSV